MIKVIFVAVERLFLLFGRLLITFFLAKIYRDQVCTIVLSMLEKRIRSILTIALQTIGQDAAFPLPRARSIEMKYLLERMFSWNPHEHHKRQLFVNSRPFLLDLLKCASKDWIWTENVYRCLEIVI
jgi:hypothetical protein